MITNQSKLYSKYFGSAHIDEMNFYYRKHFVKPNLLQKIKRLATILFYRFSYRNVITSEGKPNTVFLFSNDYNNRPDHLKYFFNVANLIHNKIVVQGIALFKPSKPKLVGIPISVFFGFLKGLKSQGEEYYWELATRLYCILSDYDEVYSYIKRNNIQLKNLVTYCDVVGVDYFFTYKMNEMGINTITLQHGLYTNRNPQVFLYSHSKSFFAINEYTVKLFRGHNIDKEFHVVGMPQNISIQKSELDCDNNKEVMNVGILLDGERSFDDNVKILKIANDIAQDSRYRIYVKFHPSSPSSEYDLRQLRSSIKIEKTNVAIEKFAHNIDICILNKSTTILQLLYLNVPVLLYERTNIIDNIPETIKFLDSKDLVPKILSIYSNEYKDFYSKFKSELIPNDDISLLYKNAFNVYGIT